MAILDMTWIRSIAVSMDGRRLVGVHEEDEDRSKHHGTSAPVCICIQNSNCIRFEPAFQVAVQQATHSDVYSCSVHCQDLRSCYVSSRRSREFQSLTSTRASRSCVLLDANNDKNSIVFRDCLYSFLFFLKCSRKLDIFAKNTDFQQQSRSPCNSSEIP